jgi:hypothetical protein
MDMTRYPIHPETKAHLEGIQDPLERFKEAQSLAAEARKDVVGVPPRPHHPEDEAEPSALLVQRNEALMVLHVEYKWPKNKCCRLISVDRRTLNLGAGKVSARLPDLTEQQAIALATDLQEEWEQAASIWRTATQIRDGLVRELTSEKGAARLGVPMQSNAKLAEIGGMTTSMIAQIRVHSVNKWKKANPAQARERRKLHEKERRQALLQRIDSARASGQDSPATDTSAA